MQNYYWLKYLFLVTCSLFGISSFSQTGTILCQVKYKLGNNTEVVPFANIRIINTEIRTSTDFLGVFKVDSLPVGTYYLIASYIQIDPVLKKVEVLKDSIVEIELEFICRYNKSENDKTCPICNKSDMVVPEGYSLEIKRKPKKRIFSSDAKIQIDTTFHSAGTDERPPCYPHWYCKRDGIVF